MATGSGIPQPRGPATSDITPQVSLPSVGDDWDRMAATFDRLNSNIFRPMLARRAAQLGAEEGVEIADGEREYRPLLAFGDVAEAREAALSAAYNARIRSDIDAREADIRREYANDPDGYQQSADRAISGFLQNAPSAFAADVEAYARGRFDDGRTIVADARSLRDRQEVAQALGVRATTLQERMIALASQDGGMDSPAYAEAMAEYEQIQQQRADNPDILYSPAQREYDDAELQTGVLTARVASLAVQAYGENGRGLAGYAAGVRFLRGEVLEGDAFSDLTPEQRQSVFRDAQAQLNDFAQADREQARAEAEEEARRRAEERELVAGYRLDIMEGGMTEEQIRALDISDTQQERLLRLFRSESSRRQAEAEDALRERSAETYNGLADQASAGTLDNAEIADAQQAGLISASQARTLRSLNSATLRPIVDDVLAPVRDYGQRPGMRSRGGAELMARAEEEAARWAAANPDATLEERLAFGNTLAQRLYGQPGQGGGTQTRTATDRAAQMAELNRLRREGRITQAEFDRRRRELLDNGD